jgi:hypothetical protein
LQNVFQTHYVRKHRKGVDSFGPQKVSQTEESSDEEVRFSIALEQLHYLMYALRLERIRRTCRSDHIANRSYIHQKILFGKKCFKTEPSQKERACDECVSAVRDLGNLARAALNSAALNPNGPGLLL